jgi:hypothetical protein
VRHDADAGRALLLVDDELGHLARGRQHQRVRPGKDALGQLVGELREVHVLGRGREIGADQRHAVIRLHLLGLEDALDPVLGLDGAADRVAGVRGIGGDAAAMEDVHGLLDLARIRGTVGGQLDSQHG